LADKQVELDALKSVKGVIRHLLSLRKRTSIAEDERRLREDKSLGINMRVAIEYRLTCKRLLQGAIDEIDAVMREVIEDTSM